MESVADQVSGSVKPRQTDNAYWSVLSGRKQVESHVSPYGDRRAGRKKTVLKPAAPLS